ncbi:MAG TPA: long-chain-fatty-acid--CoA ligase [Sporichthya sp.]|nr:long-chain-fatty-acid--CoA ligase [Sporichthya sp.]
MYLTQPVHRSLQTKPDDTATICADRQFTVAQQADRVARLAGGLVGLDVSPGDRVAYLGLNSDRYLQYYLAVPWADAVVVPVNSRWSPQEIAFSLTDSGTEILIVDDTFLPAVDAIRAAAPGLRTVVHAGDGPTPDGLISWDDLASSAPVADARRGGDALAGIFYTGGTTGFPKGVMLSHRNLVTNALGGVATGTNLPGGRFLHVAPMFHIADYCCTVAVNLTLGSHVTVPGADPLIAMAAVQQHQVTSLGLIPIIIGMIVDHPEISTYDLSSVQRVGYGGSSITVALLERAKKALPGASFCQLFGQTEAGPFLTALLAADHVDIERPNLLRSAGRAMVHTEVKIVDPDGNECPRGVQGEIVGRGDNVMQGYWNRPEETAAALRNGWLHTGDAGAMDEEGYVYVLDRIKDMIVSGGENVFSAEVENALAAHPAVAASAVIGLPDETWGERVHACVVLKPGLSVETEELRDHVRGLIAGYKVPRTVEFVDTLPASPAGKILKRELRAARS